MPCIAQALERCCGRFYEDILMKLLHRFPLLAAAIALVALTGCRAPLAVNRSLVPKRGALRDKSLLGVWRFQHHATGKPVHSIFFVYPLGKKRYLLTCCNFRPTAPGGKPTLQGTLTGTFIGSLTRIRGRLWMSCRCLDPRLIRSPAMEAWWEKHAPAGQPAKYAAALKKAGLASGRATGMARIFYLVELRKVSANRLEAYPLLVPQTSPHAPFNVPTGILRSRKKLIAFLNSHTLAHLLPKQPWVLVRLSVAQAGPYMPAQ